MLGAKILIPAIGALALFAFSGSSASAKPANGKPAPKSGADVVPPPDLLAKINAAFLAADPGVIRKVADEAEAAGFKAQADDLRAFAKKIEEAIKATPQPDKTPTVATMPPARDPGPVPAVTPTQAQAQGEKETVLPEVLIVASPTGTGNTQQAKLLAGKTALMLRNASKGSEDQGLVSAFQAQELELNHAPGGQWGSTPSKVDGMYGAKLAVVLAKHYGIVPPKPLYWPKGSWLQVKKDYRAEMARFAANDAPRQDEWLAAGRVL
jgi:hypothetical protein